MTQEINRILGSIADYKSNLKASDLTLKDRKLLMMKQDKTNIEFITLATALFKFNINTKIAIFDDSWKELLIISDKLSIIMYSILYHINPEHISSVTDNSTLIPVLDISELATIGDYVDSIIENGIGNLNNYNNSIAYLIRTNSSALFDAAGLTDRGELENRTADEPEFDLNYIQLNCKHFLGVYSYLYTAMLKMTDKYLDPFNYMSGFNDITIYQLAVSSYVLTGSIIDPADVDHRPSDRYSRRLEYIYKEYNSKNMYKFFRVNDSSKSYHTPNRIFLFEFDNNTIVESSCSSNITFNEYVYLALVAVAMYEDKSMSDAISTLSTYKIRIYAHVTNIDKVSEISFKFDISLTQNIWSNNVSVLHRIRFIHEDINEKTIIPALMHEVGYNFNKYLSIVARSANTIDDVYIPKLIDQLYGDKDKLTLTSRAKYTESYMSNVSADITHIDIDNIPNINDINRRITYKSIIADTLSELVV